MHRAKRLNPMPPLLLALWLAVFSIPAFSAPRHKSSGAHHKIEVVAGQVVAYSGGQACLKESAYWSIVIHLQPGQVIPDEFIRVDFSLPCGKSPKWASAARPAEEFRLHRQVDCKVVLAGDLAGDNKSKALPGMPLWTVPPGVEPVRLPFGQILPSYLSEDLPLKPLL